MLGNACCRLRIAEPEGVCRQTFNGGRAGEFGQFLEVARFDFSALNDEMHGKFRSKK
jgi:hypothetical protein